MILDILFLDGSFSAIGPVGCELKNGASCMRVSHLTGAYYMSITWLTSRWLEHCRSGVQHPSVAN